MPLPAGDKPQVRIDLDHGSTRVTANYNFSSEKAIAFNSRLLEELFDMPIEAILSEPDQFSGMKVRYCREKNGEYTEIRLYKESYGISPEQIASMLTPN